MATPNRNGDEGTTLIELAIVMAVSAVLVLLIIQAMISFDRSRMPRQLVADLQGEGRFGLSVLAREIQAGAAAAPTGVVWADLGGRTSRPAVQIFNDVQGGGWIDDLQSGRYAVKRNTDALLLVRAQNGYGATLVGDHFQTQTLAVSTTEPFAGGGTVLFGQYDDASWGSIDTVSADLKLTSATSLFPGQYATRLYSGSFVRLAWARLYYVDAADELVRVTLTVPRSPASADETGTREILAQGIENLQIDCQVDNGTILAACPAPLPATDTLSIESTQMFGNFGAGQGPRITAGNVSTLRTVSLSIAVRSAKPVAEAQQGDPKVPLDGKTLAVGTKGGASDSAYYVRRAYLIQLAVRNLGLGVL